MLPDTPETVAELVPWMLACAVLAIGAVGRWMMSRITRDEDRRDDTVEALRAQNALLVHANAEIPNLVARTRALSMVTRDGDDTHPNPRIEEARTFAVSAASRAEVAHRAATPEGT